MNHGLLLAPPILEAEDPKRHHVFGWYTGAALRPVLMPGGHGWGAFRPNPEVQAKNSIETFNCTNYGTNNAWETIAAFKGYDDFPKDCSERYTGIASGTTAAGNEPHHVAEVIRTVCGEIPELSLPFNETVTTFDDYYSPKDLGALKLFGRRLLNKFDFGHAWVVFIGSSLTVAQKTQRIKDALQYGPLCVAVYAWRQGEDDLYFREPGDPDTHWVELLDFVEGKYWVVWDSYDQNEKHLRWDFDFGAAKVYYLDRKVSTAPRTFWDAIWDLFRKNNLLGLWHG